MKKQILSLSIAILSLTAAQAQQIFVDEDFNASKTLPTGWTTTAISGTDLWQVGDSVNNTELANWGNTNNSGLTNIDSSNMAFFDDDRLGSSSTNNTAALLTPTFDNSLSGVTDLKFDYNFREVIGISDSFYVQVFDGAVWQTIFSVTVDDCGAYKADCVNGDFPSFSADISAYANANCQVRFVYHDGSDWGWHAGVDNVSITAPLDNDIELTEIITPAEDACGLDSNQQITVKIKNKGTSPATNFTLSVDIDNGTQTATETISDTIQGEDSLIYTTTATFNLEDIREYDLTAYVVWGPDAGPLNDTITDYKFTNEPAFTLPYFDGFETLKDSSDWRTYGTRSSWDLGFPGGNVISFASQANFAWVTSLNGEYNDNEFSFVESPCLDLSEESGDPFVSFDVWYDTEGDFDFLQLQFSTDKGTTWQTVPVSPLAKNWYDRPSKFNPTFWASKSGGWLAAENVLKGAAGNSEVLVRFLFDSDGSNIGVQPDGAAIDNFKLTPSDSIDLFLDEILFPEANFVPECGYGFENIELRLQNRGFTDVDSFTVGFILNNQPAVKETVNMTFDAFSQTKYTFQALADFSAKQLHQLTAWVEIPGDGNTANDTILDIFIDNNGPPNQITPLKVAFEDGFFAGTNAANANSSIPNSWQRSQGFTFRVANSPVNLPNSSGPASDHTGNNGNFIYTEPTLGNQGEFAVIETPCLNFTQKDGVTLEFWYHAFGGPYPNGVRIDVFNGFEWDEEVDLITTFPQTNRNSPWTFYSLNLDQYAGKNIKVRIRVEHPGGFSPRTVFAVDDLLLYNPIDQDAEVVSIDGPISDCAISATSQVEVTLSNFGLLPIEADSMNVFYQIETETDTVLVKDTVDFRILPGNEISFFFTQTADLSIPGETYNIKVWTQLNGDSNFGNDSILDFQVTNFTRFPGYIEDFEANNFVDGSCLNPVNDILTRGWTVNDEQFTWNLQDARICRGPNGSTPTFGTGPEGDHTTAQGNGTFMYTESTLTGNTEALLTSPCIDFSESTGAAMAFWYHRFGPGMGDLFIDVKADGIWNMGVDTLIGQAQTGIADPWKLQSVNLGTFAGKLIQIRFRGIRGSGTSDMAIDDIEIFEPIPADARVSNVLTPITECDPDGQVEVRVENFGLDTIFANSIRVSFNVNGGPPVSDTVDVTLAPGEFTNHIFSTPGSFLTPNTTFRMLSWTELNGDINTFNDTTAYRFTNLTQTPQYTENFEGFRDGNIDFNCANPNAPDIFLRGWEADPRVGSANFHWNLNNAAACGAPPINGGPRIDNSRGGGNFFYAQSNLPGANAFLYLPCIDFRNESTAGISFYYHTFGNVGGVIAVDVFDDSLAQWVEADRVTGSDQIANTSDWIQKFVKLDQFGGRLLEIRFRAIKTSGATALAIDDIGFYLPQERDAEMLEVLGPVAGCEVFDSSIVSVRFRNFGTKDFAQADLDLYYQIDNQPPVRETFVGNFAGSVPEDTVIDYTFNTPADLSINGKTYNIKAWTSLQNEQNVSNDTLFEFKVENSTKKTNYFENMETFRDANCAGALGQVTQNGWVVTSGTNGYTWHVQSSLCRAGFDKGTPTPLTGPDGDHTTGDGMFLYVDAGNNDFTNAFSENQLRGTATFESPCIDLRPNTNPRLSFWYHRYGGRVGNLFIDAFTDNGWVEIDKITGQQQTSGDDLWLFKVVKLDTVVGQRILLRFRAEDRADNFSESGIFGDLAIDDISIYEQAATDIGITEMLSPGITDGCVVGSNTQVRVKLKNFGLDTIDSASVFLSYIYGGIEVFDTLRQSLNPGETTNFTFANSLDLSAEKGVNLLRIFATLSGDEQAENNIIQRKINNRQPGLPRYFMDFENHSAGASYNGNDMQGWRRTPRNGGPGTYMWHVQCGPGPYVDGMMPVPPPGPPSGPTGDHTFSNSFQNGVGCYMLVESNLPVPPLVTPDAFLELPCGEMDFSQSKNNKILLSFWYHMFGGDMGDLFVDVHDGNKWVNRVDVIRGSQQFVKTDRWKQRQVSLDNFAGLKKVKVRFRAAISGRSGDIGIDDVEILDRVDNDASIVRIIDPESDCDLTTTERFRVRLQNVGTQDILETVLGYQITFTPITNDSNIKPEPQVMKIVRDTAVGINGFIAPLAFQTFAFERIDMSEPGSYEIKVWTEIEGDKNFFNDTLVETIINQTRPFPFCEDFSDMTLGDAPTNLRDGAFPNGWIGTTVPVYQWVPSIEGAGPTIGHTGGNNDMYMLLNPAPIPGLTASLESPCFDLTNTPAAILEFWVQAPFNTHFMVVEARGQGTGWQVVDTVQGFAKFKWTKETIVLTDFVGDFVQVRFTGTNLGSYYAIDDVCIKRPEPQQMQLERIVNPGIGRCLYSDQEVVRIRVQNTGLDRIDSFQVVLAFDSAFQNFPIGRNLRDTVWVDLTTPPFFDPGVELDIDLNLPNFLLDMAAQDVSYFINVFTLLEGDNNLEDNKIEDYTVFHPIPIKLPYVESFELVAGEGQGPGYSNGIFVQNSPFYGWTEAQGLIPGKGGTTGPAVDHTKATSQGVYMSTNDFPGPSRAGDVGILNTRCIDLTQTINPQLTYWYYMFGLFGMGNMFIQANNDFGWVTIDSLSGSVQTTNFQKWIKRDINLSQFNGRSIRLRFISFRGTDFSNMAIDDLSVIDLAATDITPFSLAEPNDDTTSCYTEDQQVKVELRNNGSDSVDFTVDTSFITVDIFKKGVLIKTLKDTLSENIWLDPTNNAKPLPRDSTTIFTLDGTFDMTDFDETYRFIINVRTVNDVITQNDQLNTSVLSQIKGGFISRVAPNDVVCFGTPVRLRLEDHFGAVRWEEKTLTASGQDFWFPGISFPFDERIYQTIPDSTTWFRARICNSLDILSDSFKVEVIKPYQPTAIHDTVCGPGLDPVRLRASTVFNIDRVRMYDSLTGGNLIANRAVPFGYTDTVLQTDTFYLESVINSPEVPDGRCVGITRTPVFAVIDTIPNPPLVDFSRLEQCGTPPSQPRNPGDPRTCYFIENTDTILSICQDTSFLIDGGRKAGRRDTYQWTVINPDGSIVTAADSAALNNQTVVVDAFQLELNQTYGYTVVVTSDAGCQNITTSAGLPDNAPDTIWVRVTDSCVTSVAEVSFKQNFEIYPNPVSEELKILHQSNQNFKGSIELSTVEGKLIQRDVNLNFGQLNHRIDMGKLPKGIYIIKVDSERGSFVEKIIKS